MCLCVYVLVCVWAAASVTRSAPSAICNSLQHFLPPLASLPIHHSPPHVRGQPCSLVAFANDTEITIATTTCFPCPSSLQLWHSITRLCDTEITIGNTTCFPCPSWQGTTRLATALGVHSSIHTSGASPAAL